MISTVLYPGVSQIQENVSDFKRGIVEEKATRKQGRADKQNQHRQTVAEKRMELDKAKQSTGSVTKGTAPVHERPVTTPVPAKAAPKQDSTVKERPATVTREQSSVKKEPVMKQQDNVRTQVIRESSSPAVNKQSAPVVSSTRQTVQRQKQTKTTQKKNVTKSTMNKTAHRKGNKK